MRAWELNEMNAYNMTTHDKLWVNAEKKQIIDVPTDKHHTQFAYEHPEKFGLSGNLFKGYEYPPGDNGKPAQYDEKVAVAVYDAGWARVNADPPEVSIQCMDLNQCAATLRVVKQKYNDIDTAHIDIGAKITPSEHYVLYSDEFGKGSFRTFMRTGKITS